MDSAIRTAEAKNEVCRGGTTIHITRCQGATASGGMRRQKALIEAGSWHNNPPLGVHRINEQKSNRYDNPNRKIQISIPQTEPLTSVHPLCKEGCCGILSSSFQPMGLQGPWHLRPLGTDYHAANSHFAHRAATAKAWSIQKRPAKGHPPSLSKELEMQVERNTYWMPIIPS